MSAAVLKDDLDLSFVPITTFRSKMSEVMDQMHRSPVGLTKGANKRPFAVVMAFDEYQAMREALASAEDAELGANAKKAGTQMLGTEQALKTLQRIAGVKGVELGRKV